MKNPILSTSALLVSTFGLMLTGCRADNVPQPAPIVDGNAATSDPTAVNMAAPLYAANTGAPVTRVAANAYQAAPQSSSESYAQQAPAPQSGNYGVGNSQQNEAYQYNTQQPAYSGDPNQQPQQGQQGYYAPQQGDPNAAANAAEYDEYSDLLDPNTPAATEAPPPLPSDYEQPEAPGPDYMWTPGYWDYANTGYYYVPGVWVAAPYAGALWTPGWWGFVGNRYRWHHGYWGRHVGYYGGINYGFGFIGFGYQGGYWNGDHFFYNRAVNHIEPRYVNNYVYSRNVTVINRTYINNTRVSYAGGPGGVNRRPVAAEFAAQHEVHTAPMAAQIANRREAEGNRQQFFNANHGRPATVFAARPLAADHNVAAPPRTMPSQNFSGRPGEANRPGEPMNRPGVAPNGNMNLQQRQQFDQQRQGMEQQRQQMDQQRQQQQQMQQRQQFDAQHQQQNQQQMQQRQQEQAQQQQRMQQEQQQRQQQQVNQQHEQQQRVQDQQQQQQRQQEQQRQQQAQQQQVQQRQQDQQRQQMQMNQQREQQQRVQEQQHQQQAQQQQQQQRMQQEQQQRQQQQMNQQRAQQEQQQRAQQMQHQQQQIQQQHAAPAAPHMEAPHGAAPHGGPEHR